MPGYNIILKLRYNRAIAINSYSDMLNSTKANNRAISIKYARDSSMNRMDSYTDMSERGNVAIVTNHTKHIKHSKYTNYAKYTQCIARGQLPRENKGIGGIMWKQEPSRQVPTGR